MCMYIRTYHACIGCFSKGLLNVAFGKKPLWQGGAGMLARTRNAWNDTIEKRHEQLTDFFEQHVDAYQPFIFSNTEYSMVWCQISSGIRGCSGPGCQIWVTDLVSLGPCLICWVPGFKFDKVLPFLVVSRKVILMSHCHPIFGRNRWIKIAIKEPQDPSKWTDLTYDMDEFYPLVNVYRKQWKITMLSMGKSTISTGPFSMSQTVSHYQRLVFSKWWSSINIHQI